MPDKLDRFDQAILRILSIEGRITFTELANRIGLTKTPCQTRVHRLEKEGYIRSYRAQIDPSMMGRRHVAFVQVSLTDTRDAALKAFNAAVARLPEVEQCHMIAGGFDYLLKIRTSDIQGYRAVLGEHISALPHVASTSTFFAMETVKE